VRVLVVEPGPNFSVADVCRGWVEGLRNAGCEVAVFNLADRLGYYEQANKAIGIEDPDGHRAAELAAEGLRACAMDFWPDLVLIVSSFYVPPFTFKVLRGRGIPVAVLFTESPYEDDSQVKIAAHCDIALVNDPTNLDRFRAVNPCSFYAPHAFLPSVHMPGQPDPDLASDFCFVGTGYPSRVEFLEAVDWTGIDVALAGNWQKLADDSPLRKFIAHDIEHCLDNDDTARMYASTKASVNLYRVEAQRSGLAQGWAMGPREVELAATGTFFLRDSRPESDLVLPMLPTFTDPDDFGNKLRWWLAHDTERREAAEMARAAVADRTFDNNARRLLELV
jgi:spore maturation protein CgeB